MSYSKIDPQKIESISEQEFRAFVGEPLTKTRTEVREHFNLNHATLRSLLSRYRLTEYVITGAKLYESIGKYLKENPGTTYNELSEVFNTTYKKAYRAVKSKDLQDLIRKETQEEIQAKIEETNLKRFGHRNPTQNKEVQEKARQTNLERYGVEYVITAPKVQKKIRQTFNERYGVDYVYEIPDIRDKARKTMIERYGVENSMHLPETVAKVQATNMKRYGAKYKPPAKDQIQKRKETMFRRYGTNNPAKSPEAIRKAQETLLTNEYRESRGWFTINENNTHLLLDVNAFKEELSSYEEKPTILEFIEEKELPIRTVYNFIKNNDLQDYFDIRWGTSRPEHEIYTFLKSIGIAENQIIRNDREVIKPYEIDLYLPEHKIGIEFNGTYYHSTLMGYDKKRHQVKSLETEKLGINLYQIFEFDWNKEHKREIIKSQIRNLVGKNENTIYARQCEIREVDNKTTKEFMETNHMQGDGNLNKQINYGLYKDNTLVYMMTFGKWRRGFKGIIDYEIFRSCSLLNTTVIGGASKLFKHFTKSYPEAVIGTYSNLQTGDGSLYSLLGFEYKHVTEPTSFKVNRRDEVFTLFSKEYQESRKKGSEEFYYELYNAGSKLWVYNPIKVIT